MKQSTVRRLLAALLLTAPVAMAQSSSAKPRTIVTSDGEADDIDTFIRMLLYANELDVVGLVYSS